MCWEKWHLLHRILIKCSVLKFEWWNHRYELKFVYTTIQYVMFWHNYQTGTKVLLLKLRFFLQSNFVSHYNNGIYLWNVERCNDKGNLLIFIFVLSFSLLISQLRICQPWRWFLWFWRISVDSTHANANAFQFQLFPFYICELRRILLDILRSCK